MAKNGLVLEGGGMRGLFTVGVLDAFMEADLSFDCCLGVSAGATHGASFVSGQPGRNKRVMLDYINDPRYFGLGNLLREGNIFGTAFAYEEVPNRLVPFHYEDFYGSSTDFAVGITDCETGNGVFLDHRDCREDILDVLRASCSLPFVARPVTIRGRQYMDGGISVPIPVDQARERGCGKLVVVLTRPEGYRKAPSGATALARVVYRKYPGLVETMETRHERYNETLERLEDEHRRGTLFLLRPETSNPVARLEKDTAKLETLYREGLAAGRASLPQLKRYLQQT